MANRIEEAFNDCFERLLFGESLDSCLRSYPEYAAELDMMLRVAYDVKRRAYPIQPRPEFKYWSRVRLQGVQDYMSRHAVPEKASPFNFRRNLAISVAGLLVLVIASSGTAAASNEALPDQPLYGVKMAVEQAQLAFAVSDVDKAELYANLAEKRANEIQAMARQGKSEYLASTATKMDYQLEQAETYIARYQAANAMGTPAFESTLQGEAGTAGTTEQVPQPAPGTTPTPPPAATTTVVPPDETSTVVPPAATSTGETTDHTTQTTQDTTPVKPPATFSAKPPDGQTTVKRPLPSAAKVATVNKAKNTLNTSTAKSLATLQDALEKAPESARPAIIKAIERVKQSNTWSQTTLNEGRDNKPDVYVPRPNTFPVKPPPDAKKFNYNNNNNLVSPDKPADSTRDTTKPTVTIPTTQIKAPVTTSATGSTDTGVIKTPVINSTTGTVTSTTTREGSDDSSTKGSSVITNTINTITSTDTREGGGDSSTTQGLLK